MNPRLPTLGILLAIGSIGSALAGETAISFSRFGADDYQSFVQNWDEKALPVRSALLRSPAEWDAVFHPAPVMRGRKPFGPAAQEFATNDFLVVARVIPAPTGEVFKVEQVTAENDTLTVRYTFTAPRPASYDVKQFLGLRLPKRPFAKVVLIENGQPAGSFAPPAANP